MFTANNIPKGKGGREYDYKPIAHRMAEKWSAPATSCNVAHYFDIKFSQSFDVLQ